MVVLICSRYQHSYRHIICKFSPTLWITFPPFNGPWRTKILIWITSICLLLLLLLLPVFLESYPRNYCQIHHAIFYVLLYDFKKFTSKLGLSYLGFCKGSISFLHADTRFCNTICWKILLSPLNCPTSLRIIWLYAKVYLSAISSPNKSISGLSWMRQAKKQSQKFTLKWGGKG